MPYDPNIPQAGTEIDAVQMRGQLNGLKDLIDAVPAIASAQVDAVNTLPAGDPATVSVSVTGTVLHLTFGIPQGQEGQTGAPGEVTTVALDAAIATTSSNSNAVATLGETADSSYNQPQMQNVINKLDELITILRRG